MRISATLAILLALASWVALWFTFSNLLSGSLETRTCQTDCVRNYYFAAAGAGLVSVLLALIAFFKARLSAGSFLLVLFCAFPIAVVAGIFAIGTLGTMPH